MITYCTNIHPSHTWPETRRQVLAHIPRIKQAVSPDDAFAVGLRLSNRAACELDDLEAGRFAGWCDVSGCYIATINGFPFDSFYNRALKGKSIYTRLAQPGKSSVHPKIGPPAGPVASTGPDRINFHFAVGFRIENDGSGLAP
jgi:hypothetical protein